MVQQAQGMVLDVSQAVINRTAMYNITLDTIAILGDRVHSFQAFGEKYPTTNSLSELKPQASRLFDMLGGIGSSTSVPTVKRRPPGPPILYLDPLYVLLGGLDVQDAVMVLDMSTATNPEWHNPAVAKAYRAAFDQIQAIRPHVLCISSNTKEAFRANYGFPSDRMTVVPLYVPAHLNSGTERLFPVRPYVLFVGSLETRKNLRGAIESFALSNLAKQGFDLVVAGGHGHGANDIQSLAAQTDGVRLLGFITNAELQALYSSASAFLYPSYLEGFGVPLLEAMNSGVPAVASRTGACPEVGGPLVKYVDPDDCGAIAAALIELVALPNAARLEYARLCREWILERFTLGTYAQTLLSMLRAGGFVAA